MTPAAAPFQLPGSSLPLHFSPDACLVLVFPSGMCHFFLTPGTCLSDSQRGMSSGFLHTDTVCSQQVVSTEVTARGCVLPLLPSHWDLHCSPYPSTGSGFLLMSIVECPGCYFSACGGVCLETDSLSYTLPQPRVQPLGGGCEQVSVGKLDLQEFSGSSVSNLFWGKGVIQESVGNDMGVHSPKCSALGSSVRATSMITTISVARHAS